MDALVEKLSNGRHRLATSRYKTATELGECLDSGLVLVRFTETRGGGTELAVRLNKDQTQTAHADFTRGVGTVRLVGELSLNYEKVRCIADIDLQSLTGEGHLERLS